MALSQSTSETRGQGAGAREPILSVVASLLAGAVGGFLAAQRLGQPLRYPQAQVWERELVERHGHVKGTILAQRVQTRYAQLYAERPRFSERALRMHLERHILPGLALYRTLLAAHANKPAVLKETARLLEASLLAQRDSLDLLKVLPAALFLRVAGRLTIQRDFPAVGWEIEGIEDSPARLAFNVHHCFYQEVLAAYEAPELTALFCHLDNVRFTKLPPGLLWERTQTLGHGDPMCDFCWRRVAPTEVSHDRNDEA
ncbi:MAG: L-2-amino-thiazoline-4-carboxylic acid hydrolase [Anaerolineae bacterium]|nr:L-2-amino-thiazoline-4-carboxylic acid hydrolase [Anaerolineae bacterium]